MRVLKIAVPSLVLLGGLAGCGAAADSVAAAPTGVKSSASAGDGAVCRTADVDVDITAQPDQDGDARMGLVAVTNKGERACTVNGWVSFTLVNAADEPVDVDTDKVEQPGAASEIALEPGRSAFSGIKWTVCDKGDSACGVGNTIRYDLGESTDGPPATLDGFPAGEQSGITMGSLQIGTLQPVTQGVVAW